MVKKSENTCWNCGKENHGEKCSCGATQDSPPRLGPPALGMPRYLLGKDNEGILSGTPASVKYDEFKMPSPAKQPGRKPIKGQKPLFNV